MSDITQWAASLDGARIPGGCDDCNASQTVHAIMRGVTRIKIHHDDWCPTLARHENRAARRARKSGSQK